MSERGRNIAVGLFVLAGAFGIGTCAAILGGGGAFEERIRMESYFDEAVTGLAVGSPLRYRGVTIGQVVSIGFVQDYYDLSLEDRLEYGQRVSVLFERSFRKDEREDVKARSVAQHGEWLEELIARGLRFRIASSGLTGTSFVQADILDPEDYPPMTITWEPRHLYVPSAPSTFTALTQSAERIIDRLEAVDLGKLADSAISLLESLDGAAGELDLAALQGSVIGLADDLRTTVGDIQAAVAAADVPEISRKAQLTLDQANSALARIERTVDGGRYDLEVSLENLRVATENLRDLTDLLKRQPSLLLRGEPTTPTEPGAEG